MFFLFLVHMTALWCVVFFVQVEVHRESEGGLLVLSEDYEIYKKGLYTIWSI
jgi:hypothetical protein